MAERRGKARPAYDVGELHKLLASAGQPSDSAKPSDGPPTAAPDPAAEPTSAVTDGSPDATVTPAEIPDVTLIEPTAESGEPTTPTTSTTTQPSDGQRGLLRESAPVAVGTALSRITGLIRTAILAAVLARTALAGMYAFGNIVPNLLYELVLGGVISATLLPMFTSARVKKDSESPSVLVSTALQVLTALSALAVLLAGAIAWFAERSADAGGDADLTHFKITAFGILAALLVPQVLFYGFTSIATAALNAHGIYSPPAFSPILTNIVTSVAFVCTGLLIGGDSDLLNVTRISTPVLFMLGVGTTVGIAAMALPLIKPLRSVMPDLAWMPRLTHPVVRETLRLSGWTVGYVIANQISVLVLALAVGGGTNYVTYTTAFVFFQLPHGLLAVSIMTTTTPRLSEAFAHQDLEQYRTHFINGIRLLTVLIVPAAVGLFMFAHPIVALLLQRGNFQDSDSAAVAQTLRAFALGLPGFSAFLFIIRGFYAQKDTRTPFRLNLIENAITIVGAIAVAGILTATQHGALYDENNVYIGANKATPIALVYSLGYIIAAVLAYRRLSRSINGFSSTTRTEVAQLCTRIAVASAAMALFALPVVFIEHPGTLISTLTLVVGIPICTAVYFQLCSAMKVQESQTFFDGVQSLRARIGSRDSN